MTAAKLIFIGCGAHGRVCLDLLRDSGGSLYGFLDDQQNDGGTGCAGVPLLGPVGRATELSAPEYAYVITVGNNLVRRRIAERLRLAVSAYTNLIHRSSVISPTATLGTGVMACAQTYIGAGACIGNHVIINNGAIVEHDCIVHDFVSVSPGARMGGRVEIGAGAFISTGVTIAPRVRIGAGAIIGAGAVVVNDVADGVLSYGVPARTIRTIDSPDIWNSLL